MKEQGRIAVLGATGLVGRHLVKALFEQGATDVFATYRAREPYELPGLEWRHADLTNLDEARTALAGAKVVLHCAGKLSTTAELRRDPMSSVTDTLRIGANVLEAAAREKVGRLVMLSSCTGYPEGATSRQEGGMFTGDPPPAWFGVGWMHRYLEKQLEWYCRHLQLIGAATALRPTLIYGPHDDFKPESAHFVPSFIHRVVARETPIEVWGDGEQTRNLVHAGDVASAMIAALGQGKGYQAYNVATPASVSVNDVLNLLIELDGFADAKIVYRPEKAGGASALTVSGDAFAARFGWRPAMSLRAGLADTLDWYRKTAKLAR
ncbi:MAG: NAD(P)-dependent oxidoreductase [Proteobacteria bacterium]|nr:NAD(P)-dependent oxidoreductase [Pseudomonadota bacterium]